MICQHRFDCSGFMVYDCLGYDCLNDGRDYDTLHNDYDQDDADFIG